MRAQQPPPDYEGPERRQPIHVACPSPVLELRISNLEEWQRRQNGTLQEIDKKIQAGAEDRQRQIKDVRDSVDATRRDLSDYHTETLKEVAAGSQRTLTIVIGAAVSGLVLMFGAIITLLSKLGGLP